MARALIIIGGIVNILFAAFHVYLGTRINGWVNLSENTRAMLMMFNVGGTLTIAFFALVSLVCSRELLSTTLGKITCGAVGLFYFVRAVEEFIYPPVTAWIAISCLVVTALYVIPLFIRGRKTAFE
jgi:hypothetical protein